MSDERLRRLEREAVRDPSAARSLSAARSRVGVLGLELLVAGTGTRMRRLSDVAPWSRVDVEDDQEDEADWPLFAGGAA